MITQDGKDISSEGEKVNIFESYYQNLYQTTNPDHKNVNTFLEGLEIKKISDLQLSEIEEPVKQEEITLAIFKLKK